MENAYTQVKKTDGGYLTLFACLLFLVMMTLLFVCLDGILIYQGKSKATMDMAGAGEHLLANYDEVLAKRYGLYFLDSNMETRLQARTEVYFEERQGTLSGIKSRPILDIKAEQIQVNAFGTMQEQDCRYFIEQVVELVKYDTAKEVLVQLLSDSAQSLRNQNGKIENTKQKLEDQEAAVQAAFEENTEDVTAPSNAESRKQAASLAQAGSPVSVVKDIFQKGILAFVTDNGNLSEKEISSTNLPSHSKKEKMPVLSFRAIQNLKDCKELLEQTVLELPENMKESGALALYGQDYFNYFTREDVLSDTELLYEYEYILGGQTSDIENLEYTAKKLILLRFVLNSAYVFSNLPLNEQALVLAGQLTGITGSPVIVEGTKYIILSVVSLIESFYDVRALMAGEEVPLLKNDGTFQTSVTGGFVKKQGMKGLSYEKYLMLLFFLGTDRQEQCLRMQDLMQCNISREKPGFSILKPKVGVRIEAVFKQKGKFLPGSYSHERKENYSY